MEKASRPVRSQRLIRPGDCIGRRSFHPRNVAHYRSRGRALAVAFLWQAWAAVVRLQRLIPRFSELVARKARQHVARSGTAMMTSIPPIINGTKGAVPRITVDRGLAVIP